MSIIDPTPAQRRHPVEGFAMSQPAWAERTDVGDDMNSASITHQWSPGNPAECFVHSDETSHPVLVELIQHDTLFVADGSVRYDIGAPYIFLGALDSGFEDVVEARKFAEAILACCDRLEGPE